MLVCNSLKMKTMPVPIRKLAKKKKKRRENALESAHTVIRQEDAERQYLKWKRR